jgi:hypothetical protein
MPSLSADDDGGLGFGGRVPDRSYPGVHRGDTTATRGAEHEEGREADQGIPGARVVPGEAGWDGSGRGLRISPGGLNTIRYSHRLTTAQGPFDPKVTLGHLLIQITAYSASMPIVSLIPLSRVPLSTGVPCSPAQVDHPPSPGPLHPPDFDVPVGVLRAGIRSRPPPRDVTSTDPQSL